MGSVLEDMHEAHKARKLRIQQAAYRDLTATQHSSGIDAPEPFEPPAPPPPIIVNDAKVTGHAFGIVLREVCSHFNVRPEDVLSNRRFNNIAVPRHILTYLLCRLTKYTINQIAPKMDRDPSSIFYGYKKIENNLSLHERDLGVLEPRLKQLLPRW